MKDEPYRPFLIDPDRPEFGWLDDKKIDQQTRHLMAIAVEKIERRAAEPMKDLFNNDIPPAPFKCCDAIFDPGEASGLQLNYCYLPKGHTSHHAGGSVMWNLSAAEKAELIANGKKPQRDLE